MQRVIIFTQRMVFWTHSSSQTRVQGPRFSSLKLVMMGVFPPLKSANSTNQPSWLLPIYQCTIAKNPPYALNCNQRQSSPSLWPRGLTSPPSAGISPPFTCSASAHEPYTYSSDVPWIACLLCVESSFPRSFFRPQLRCHLPRGLLWPYPLHSLLQHPILSFFAEFTTS